jgi:hypothetical protein
MTTFVISSARPCIEADQEFGSGEAAPFLLVFGIFGAAFHQLAGFRVPSGGMK